MKNINYSIDDCVIIDFKIRNSNFDFHINPVRNKIEIPFQMRRMYYLYDIPLHQKRGGHAHKDLQQVIIAIIGNFTVKLDDGDRSKIITLETPDAGLLLVPGIWRELVNFSPGAVAMVLASEVYLENDYIRNYQDFLILKKIDVPEQLLS